MRCPNCGFENPAGAKFCMNCGQRLPAAEAGDPRQALIERLLPKPLREKIEATGTIEAERRPVTVLFGDLSGFTALSEKLDPEEVRALTNECFELLVRTIFRYEGFVDKFIGDAVMVLFGAPMAHEDDPERALRCAQEMREAIESFNWTLPEGSPPLALHTGIHTGEVVAGAVGSDLRLEYTVMGDTVNLAARLQDLASPGEILVSEATYRLIKPIFDFEPLPTAVLQGKELPVNLFRLIGEREIPEPVRGLAGLASPLVGREVEFGRMKEVIDGLLVGQGHIAVIMGEPGIGKSRMVAEARHYAQEASSGRAYWHEGRCLSYERRAAYYPLVEILRSYLGIMASDDERQALGRLLRHLRRLFPGRMLDIAPYLGTLLGLRLDPQMEERVRYLDGEALQAQIFAAVREFLEAVAAEKPLVMVFDDLHWADPSTVELLKHLLDSTDRVSLGLILVARLEREAPWWQIKVEAETRYPHRYAEIELHSLSAEESNRLVDNLLTIADLPSGVRSLIQKKAEGNPFFVEEVIRGLIESGVLVRQVDRWRATSRVFDVEIPDTVQGVILARMDRLEGETRRVLQVASVLGREFMHRVLKEVYEGNGQLDRRLADLLRLELVREKARLPEREYLFKHHLTQEVAYQTLLKERRAEYHRRAAEAIERLYPERLPEFYGTLAHHYHQAGITEKAIQYSLLAGEQAAGLYANEEALTHFDGAISLLGAAGDQRGLTLALEKKGDVYFFQRLMVKAFEAYDRAIELWHQLGDPDAQALIRLYRKIGIGVGRWAGRDEPADEYLAQALALLEKAPDDLERARVLSGLAFRAITRWPWEQEKILDYEKGLAYAREAATIAERFDALPELSEAYDAMSVAYVEIGNLQEAMKIRETRLSILERIQDPFEVLDAHFMLASSLWDTGDFAAAKKAIEQGLSTAQRVGSISGQWQGFSSLAWTHFFWGRWDESRAFAEEGLRLRALLDDPWPQVQFLLVHYLILTLRGQHDEGAKYRKEVDEHLLVGRGGRRLPVAVDGLAFSALGIWEKGLPALEAALASPGGVPPQIELQAMFAEALAETRHLEEAQEIADSLNVGEPPFMQLLAGIVRQRAYGSIHTRRGEWKEAEAAYQKGLEILKTKEMPLEKARTLHALGRMYLKRGELGDAEKARTVLQEAREIYRSLDAKPLIEQVNRLLGEVESTAK